MPAVTIPLDDLTPFTPGIDTDRAEAMITDALAIAAMIAPCINEPDFTNTAAAKAIIRGAILRWHDADSGAVTQQTAGPFSTTIDTNTRRRGMYWPSEILQLQKLCRDDARRRAAWGYNRTPTVQALDAQQAFVRDLDHV